jgi:hypothetical protein
MRPNVRCPKVDVFSAGVLATELISGRPPRPGPQRRGRVFVLEEERRASDIGAAQGCSFPSSRA